MSKDNLYIVIPAYNEEETIEMVINDWYKVVDKIKNDSKLVIIDDGSRDSTYEKALRLVDKYPNLVVLTKENEGHGATLLYGYKYAIDNGASYVFQTDSDGQTLSEEFWDFWKLRRKYTAIIGKRTKRKDGLSRIFVTKVLKLVLMIIFHLNVEDANTPFRLIKTKTLNKYYNLIPPKFNLSNVLLTVLFLDKKEKVKFLPITFKERQGGVNSINLKKIVKIGKEAIKDFILIKKSLKRSEKGK